MTRLSHSSLRLFSECGKKFDYHYNQLLRENTKSGALFFGTAVDRSIEALLKDKTSNAKALFDAIWETQDINGHMIKLPESTQVVYAASDFDFDVLLEEDQRFLIAKASELVPKLLESCNGSFLDVFREVQSHKKQQAFRTWPEREQRFHNVCNWVSLRRKGHLMLDAFTTKVAPHIKRVISTQDKIELDNGTGDLLIGYPDLVCEWEDGRTIIFDFKTSSIEYTPDSVSTSQQLTLYSFALGIQTCGFIVFRKGVLKNREKYCKVCGCKEEGRFKTCNGSAEGKRCGGEFTETTKPEVDIQIIIDEIPASTSKLIMENVEVINQAIKHGIFMRNFQSCKGPFGKCAFYNKCFNNSDEGLVKVNATTKV